MESTGDREVGQVGHEGARASPGGQRGTPEDAVNVPRPADFKRFHLGGSVENKERHRRRSCRLLGER